MLSSCRLCANAAQGIKIGLFKKLSQNNDDDEDDEDEDDEDNKVDKDNEDGEDDEDKTYIPTLHLSVCAEHT
jgi:hypothetical protein